MTAHPLDPEEAEIAAWLGAGAERTITTACAHVFLAGETVYKIKRRLDLGYGNFSTLELRRWAVERELEFNTATAPHIYRRVRPITREADGVLAISGRGETVEWLLEMQRFDETRVLADDPARLDGQTAEALGRAIAGFHAEAPERPGGGIRALAFTIGSNANILRELAPALGAAEVEALVAATNAELERLRPLLEARTTGGFARRCHGDLHLGNILMESDGPVLFDCIEFNDLLSDIDVYYDLAFLLMDLEFRGRSEAAVRVLSAYLDTAARHFPDGLWTGLEALPLMLSVRAAVRTHVAAHTGDPELARAYLAAAAGHLAPRPPALMAIGGLSGSGKSWQARRLAPQVGPAPGAVILRTDEIRKRLAGAAPDAVLPPEAYGPETHGPVYDAMFATARALLVAGRGVILDATFMDADLRARAEQTAKAAGVGFDGVWLEAPLEVLEARVAARTGDASDASLDTLRHQAGRDLGPISWRRLDASGV